MTGESLGVQAFVRADGRFDPGEEYFTSVRSKYRDFDWVKPSGGLWTSTFDAECGSDWIDWCVNNGFAGPSFYLWLLTPDPAARVYEIDTLDDLIALVKRFPAKYPIDGFPIEYPSWVAVSEVYDAVHLTREGEMNTRFTHPVNLYGWDCECTLWFRWAFTDVKSCGVYTAHSDADDRAALRGDAGP